MIREKTDMTKKNVTKENTTDSDTVKIWCPEGENFQYVKACAADCKKKDRCKPFRDYFEPKLF
jgi:hypothetical protein